MNRVQRAFLEGRAAAIGAVETTFEKIARDENLYCPSRDSDVIEVLRSHARTNGQAVLDFLLGKCSHMGSPCEMCGEGGE